MKRVDAYIILTMVLLLASIALWFKDPHTVSGLAIQDRQVAAGNWAISVQVPPCDNIQLRPPEREGDVVTIYCQTMPVKAR